MKTKDKRVDQIIKELTKDEKKEVNKLLNSGVGVVDSVQVVIWKRDLKIKRGRK